MPSPGKDVTSVKGGPLRRELRALRGGVRRAAGAVSRRLLNRRRFVIYTWDSRTEAWSETGPLPSQDRVPPGLVPGWATPEDLPRFRSLASLRKQPEFAAWLREGRDCFMWCRDGVVVYHFWLHYADHYASELGVHVPVPREAYFAHDIMTAPEYQGLHIHVAAIPHIVRRARSLGRPRVIAAVLETDFPLFRTLYRRGKITVAVPLQPIALVETWTVVGIRSARVGPPALPQGAATRGVAPAVRLVWSRRLP